MDPVADHSTKGILHADAGRLKYKLSRYEPADALRIYIQHYWAVEWDLRGQEPYRQTVLSHPNVNLVFEPERTRIYGIWEKTSTQLLEGQGSVFAVKFNPGGFYPFWRQPLSALTRRSIALSDVFGAEAGLLEADILAAAGDAAAQVERINRFFLARLPDEDENVELVNGIVAALVTDLDILKVEQLADRFDLSVRTLQRLFDRYVGVNPKGVIQRFRLHEAAERIEQGEAVDWPKLSLDMGYFDQAHFIKDFKAYLGKTPDEYMRSIPSAKPDSLR
ncbi:helix-turn-helix transcriptional regulator [Cohnella herbarum]|uniref:AraC family transcriptional regulator n=1 Tax=Cohnella herbarum TaxID=2728023 RepID=A0A7Z2VMR8_9BACL|nr:helix-turn-helix transcriptional regulator [Cohnella herbarum]QJD86133.1 AraC family transcriptional regulator [Cohnella herbarum]